jgi:transcriptional regulator with XRE-family HTH domain
MVAGGAHHRRVDFAKFLRHFGKNLRQARWLTGQTQQQVAAQGLSLRWYAELERGQQNPTLRTVFDLAQILHIAPAELLDAPGARPGIRLLDRKASAPKKGRKPKKTSRPKGKRT